MSLGLKKKGKNNFLKYRVGCTTPYTYFWGTRGIFFAIGAERMGKSDPGVIMLQNK